MEIEVKTKYKVTYQICYHEETEGGMDFDQFGQVKQNLKDAIYELELAMRSQPNRDWEIVLDVETVNQ